jgi:arabinose-5-phosphate isomerase
MLKEEIKDLIKKESEAILQIPVNDNFDKAVDIIYTQVHQKKGKVIISGMGKAGQIAINIATTFCSGGTPAVFLHPSDAQHGDLGVIRENDVLFLISNSGKTREIVELMGLVENLHGKLPLIAISGNPKCPLSEKADAFLFTGGPEEICPLGLTPTTSTTTMTVIGDVLVTLMMKKTDFTVIEYAKRHHGGYLGDKSREKSK